MALGSYNKNKDKNNKSDTSPSPFRGQSKGPSLSDMFGGTSQTMSQSVNSSSSSNSSNSSSSKANADPFSQSSSGNKSQNKQKKQTQSANKNTQSLGKRAADPPYGVGSQSRTNQNKSNIQPAIVKWKNDSKAKLTTTEVNNNQMSAEELSKHTKGMRSPRLRDYIGENGGKNNFVTDRKKQATEGEGEESSRLDQIRSEIETLRQKRDHGIRWGGEDKESINNQIEQLYKQMDKEIANKQVEAEQTSAEAEKAAATQTQSGFGDRQEAMFENKADWNRLLAKQRFQNERAMMDRRAEMRQDRTDTLMKLWDKTGEMTLKNPPPGYQSSGDTPWDKMGREQKRNVYFQNLKSKFGLTNQSGGTLNAAEYDDEKKS